MTDIEATLTSFGVAYERHEHAAVFTCEEADAAVPNVDAVQTKNLFLRDKRGRRHILLVTTCAKTIDLARFTGAIHADRLSFASEERLQRYLGVTPGSVTVLGLVHDANHAVELYVDRDVWHAPAWRCHPLVNTATLVIAREGIERFLELTGHTPHVLPL